MKFSTIGKGIIHKGKKGTKSIRLVMDGEAKKQLPRHDWREGMYIFRKQSGNKVWYEVAAPMPDDYEYQEERE